MTAVRAGACPTPADPIAGPSFTHREITTFPLARQALP
jgi:hypothetical protein